MNDVVLGIVVIISSAVHFVVCLIALAVAKRKGGGWIDGNTELSILLWPVLFPLAVIVATICVIVELIKDGRAKKMTKWHEHKP